MKTYQDLTSEQLAWFALLGANIESFQTYRDQGANLYRAVKCLRKYDDLSDAAWDYAIKQGWMEAA